MKKLRQLTRRDTLYIKNAKSFLREQFRTLIY